MGLMKAAKLAPDALLLPADFDEYRRYSRLFKDAVRALAPEIEDRGIDEIYIDLTRLVEDERGRGRAGPVGARAGDRDRHPARGARGDRAVVLDRRHAEQAALEDRLRAREARRLTVLARGRCPARIWPLPARKVNGIGPKAGARLEALGIRTIGELAQADPALLVEHFGKSYGAWMHEAAHGRDERAVVTYSEPKSISRETTFEDDLHPVRDRERLSRIFTDLCVRVADDLERKGYVGKTIGLKLRYDNFKTVTRDRTLDEPTARRRRDTPRRGRVPEARAARPAHPAARRARRGAEQVRRRCAEPSDNVVRVEAVQELNRATRWMKISSRSNASTQRTRRKNEGRKGRANGNTMKCRSRDATRQTVSALTPTDFYLKPRIAATNPQFPVWLERLLCRNLTDRFPDLAMTATGKFERVRSTRNLPVIFRAGRSTTRMTRRKAVGFDAAVRLYGVACKEDARVAVDHPLVVPNIAHLLVGSAVLPHQLVCCEVDGLVAAPVRFALCELQECPANALTLGRRARQRCLRKSHRGLLQHDGADDPARVADRHMELMAESRMTSR